LIDTIQVLMATTKVAGPEDSPVHFRAAGAKKAGSAIAG